MLQSAGPASCQGMVQASDQLQNATCGSQGGTLLPVFQLSGCALAVAPSH